MKTRKAAQMDRVTAKFLERAQAVSRQAIAGRRTRFGESSSMKICRCRKLPTAALPSEAGSTQFVRGNLLVIRDTLFIQAVTPSACDERFSQPENL